MASATGAVLLLSGWCRAQEAAPAAPAAPAQPAAVAPAPAQPPAVAPAAAEKPASAAPASTARKSRGRLPAYFATLVSAEQRQKIYDIQLTYTEKLAALDRQMAELRAKQSEEVDAVLTADQLVQIKKLREAAAAKKRNAASADATAGT
jgi:2-oxoglutarate dehydrogenase E2 component (dihydrolipoamide succinyltransferase)